MDDLDRDEEILFENEGVDHNDPTTFDGGLSQDLTFDHELSGWPIPRVVTRRAETAIEFLPAEALDILDAPSLEAPIKGDSLEPPPAEVAQAEVQISPQVRTSTSRATVCSAVVVLPTITQPPPPVSLGWLPPILAGLAGGFGFLWVLHII